MNSIETSKLIRLLEFIVQEIDENAQDSLADIVNEGLERFKLIQNRMNSDLRFF